MPFRYTFISFGILCHLMKSVFIINKPPTIPAQIRAFREKPGYAGLALEGPFSDQRGSLNIILDIIQDRVKRHGLSPVLATSSTLLPKNLPGNSPLSPFILDLSSVPVLSAGDLSDKINHEDLVLLTVAMLRRLGITSYFAYLHFNQDDPSLSATRSLVSQVSNLDTSAVPVVLLLDPEPSYICYPYPYPLPFSGAPLTRAIEVLSDDAIRSLVLIKSVSLQTEQLMRTLNSPESMAALSLSPVLMGHNLFRGITLWHPAEARVSKSAAEVGDLRSIRDIFEADYVHDTGCQPCHTLKAADIILDRDSQELIGGLLNAAVPLLAKIHGKGRKVRADFSDIFDLISRHACHRVLMSYLRQADKMFEHIHDYRHCESQN